MKWLGDSDLVPNDALAAKLDPSWADLKECKRWLGGFLKEGRKLTGEILSKGKAEGFPEGTIKKASREMKLLKTREGSTGNYWDLNPDQETLF